MADTGIDVEDLSELTSILKGMGGVSQLDKYANSYTKIPDGLYSGEIIKVEAKNSQSSGKPMIQLMIATSDGQKESVPLMLAGKDLENTEKTVARTLKQLQKLGVDISSEDLSVIVPSSYSLVGKSVVLDIKTNNNFRNVSVTLAD